ncbi:MAG TPA: DUF3817 domain-containing protein [Nocardioides sp.]
MSHTETAVQQTADKSGPRTLFARLGALEAFTWAGLLVGMFLKYVTETTELAVRIFGGLHGFVFLAYCVMAVLVGIDSRWKLARHAAALVAAVVPFLTLWTTLKVERGDWGVAPAWRLRTEHPTGLSERVTATVVRNPVKGVVGILALVAVLFVVLLFVGPPGK